MKTTESERGQSKQTNEVLSSGDGNGQYQDRACRGEIRLIDYLSSLAWINLADGKALED